MLSDNIVACAKMLEKADPDRFRAVMAAPVSARIALFPLFAFNLEIARAPWMTKEAMIAEMRLQWWYDALEDISKDKAVKHHEVLTPLAQHLTPRTAGLLMETVEARRWDIYQDAHADQDALENYIAATSGTLIAVAAAMLGQKDLTAARQYGWAIGCANYLNAIPALLDQQRVPLVDGRPQAVAALAQKGLDCLDQARQDRALIAPTARSAFLTGWTTKAVLRQAKAHPDRVIDGLYPVNPLRSAVMLLWQANTHRF